MAIFNNMSYSPRIIRYLFVDGGYLQKILQKVSEEIFSGVQIPINYQSLFNGFDKVFYYDCLPAHKSNEKEEDWKKREKEARDFFDNLRLLSGVHVFEGEVVGEGDRSRQKGIDVKIAVHMLTHSFRKNMEQATLLTGDGDFTPLVEALVQDGLHVTVWYSRYSFSQALLYAADTQREFTSAQLIPHIFEDERHKFPFPKYHGQMGAWVPPGGNNQQILEGKTLRGEKALLYKDDNNVYIGYVQTKQASFCAQHTSPDLVTKSFAEYGYKIKWD